MLGPARVTTIDHLLLTHYHGDHYGNLIALSDAGAAPATCTTTVARRKPIVPAIAAFETRYTALVRDHAADDREPGDAIPSPASTTTVVVSDSQRAGPRRCRRPPRRARPTAVRGSRRARRAVDPDNHYWAGFVMAYGRFRTVNLGDLTWSREVALMCPEQPVGTVDLYLTTHHGVDRSGSAAVVHASDPAWP